MRYEVLRRDRHRCRYCGTGPEDARLTVDHVIPEALGGPTTPENLITACDPCNSGKASVPPDAEIVADVAGRTLRWRDAIVQAAQEAERDERRLWACTNAMEGTLLLAWQVWTCTSCGRGGEEHIPEDARDSLRQWFVAGLQPQDVEDLTGAAWRARVACDSRWRYFCGCAWTRVRALHERAFKILEGG